MCTGKSVHIFVYFFAFGQLQLQDEQPIHLAPFFFCLIMYAVARPTTDNTIPITIKSIYYSLIIIVFSGAFFSAVIQRYVKTAINANTKTPPAKAPLTLSVDVSIISVPTVFTR